VTSASAFAREFSSAWKSLAPTTDIFVKKLNANLYEREAPELISDVDPSRRALINEIAFNLFFRSVTEQWEDWRPSNKAINEAAEVVLGLMSFYGETPRDENILNASETQELSSLIERFRYYFLSSSSGRELEFFPRFSGCGFIDTCAGDIFLKTTLFEVKSGDRSFRSTDLRQLLVYAALNSASQSREIQRLGLFNPRKGVSFVAGIDDVCFEISGRPSTELLTELVRLISSGDVSR
jgi:hypothetical protein